MGYTVGYEFPCAPGEYPDISELLGLYRRLTSEYTELLKQITDTNAKLDAYMAEVDSKIPGWIDQRVDSLQQRLTETIQKVERDMSSLQLQVQTYMDDVKAEVDTALNNQNAKVCKALQDLYCWVSTQIKAQEEWVRIKIDELKRYHDRDFKTLQLTIESMDGRIEDVRNLMVQLTNQLLSDMVELRAEVRDNIHMVHVWWYEERYKLKEWVHAEIDKMKTIVDGLPEQSPVIINPIRGDRFGRIQEFIDDLWNDVVPLHGWTAEEWAQQTWVTADMWHDMEFSAVEWYAYGKEIFDYRYDQWHVYSPVTGEVVTVGKAIQQVFDMLNPASIKAAEYDNWNMDAAHYDAQNITGARYRDKEFQTKFVKEDGT